jgi:hypothetical protein
MCLPVRKSMGAKREMRRERGRGGGREREEWEGA